MIKIVKKGKNIIQGYGKGGNGNVRIQEKRKQI